MTEQNPPVGDPGSNPPPQAPPPQEQQWAQQQQWSQQQPPPTPYAPYPPTPPGAGYGGTGPVGKVRSTGISILLYFVTFGIYGWFWYYGVHKEMKDHTGRGLGGGIALILAIFVGIVMPYITSSEAGDLYAARGQQKPVSAATGLWVFPGIFIIVGPFIWFVKTNGAINDYWRSLGAQ